MTEIRYRWFWVVTIANIAVTILLLLVVCASLLALSAMASLDDARPIASIVGIGSLLSMSGIFVTSRVSRPLVRRFGYVFHVAALALSALVVGYPAVLILESNTESYVIPEGYQGDVFVVHLGSGEASRKIASKVSYLIPDSGVLVVKDAVNKGLTRSEYYVQGRDGRPHKISEVWDSTIPPTLENLANDRDVGIFFPRSGTLGGTSGCSAGFDQFYIGTKAYLLKSYKETDIVGYLRDHKFGCF
jgi:hypothetical protein